MRVGYVQFGPAFGDKERNLARVGEFLGREQADLWVLPELFSTGYQFASREELAELAEPVPKGPTTQRLAALARELGCHIVAGLAERAGKALFNSAVLVGPRGFVTVYRKIHLFYRERELFTAGNVPFTPVEVAGAKVGLLVCYDHFFPEAARSLALAGAEVLAHPANLVMPGLGQMTMRVRALENRVFAVTANRVGEENRTGEPLRFTGLSQIVSPKGEVLVSSGEQGEEARVVEIEPSLARNKRINALNDLFSDRRPEFYQALTRP